MFSPNTQPLVSIIIPVYNGSNYLREAIESALAQTYRNIEIIVINDGSRDEGATERIALSYGDRIRYYKKENGGVASALNFGIAKMRGEFFSWLSHDDLYKPEKIQVQINKLSSHNDQILLFSGFDTIDKNSAFIRTHLLKNFTHYTKYEIILYTMIHGCSLLIPKTAFDAVGYFDETLKTVQDNHLWLRMAKSGYDFIYIDQPLISSRIHNEQGSVTLKEIQTQEIYKFYTWASHYVTEELECNGVLKKFVLEKAQPLSAANS